jgi:hypothetical protein
MLPDQLPARGCEYIYPPKSLTTASIHLCGSEMKLSAVILVLTASIVYQVGIFFLLYFLFKLFIFSLIFQTGVRARRTYN